MEVADPEPSSDVAQEVLSSLPDISRKQQFDRLIDVDGMFMCEVFSGEGSMTLAAIVNRVPAVAPWDVDSSKRMDVRRNGNSLFLFCALGRMIWAHQGTPCTSGTWARDPPLRDWSHLEGKPDLPPHQQEKVADGNSLVLFSAILALMLWLQGFLFSIENPWLSWLWFQVPFLLLRLLSGVAFTKTFYSDWLCEWHKPTGWLHNIRGSASLHTEKASREVSVTLRGTCWWRGEYVFRTWIAQPYPPALCNDIASHAAESGEEILNAIRDGVHPLPEGLYPTRCDLNDLPAVPPAHIQLPQPTLNLKRLWSVRSLPPQRWAEVVAVCMGVSETEWNDLFRVRCAQQSVPVCAPEPSELVKDGGGAAVGLDAQQHVEWARTDHVHPADCEPPVVSEDFRAATEFECCCAAAEIDEYRTRILALIECKALELEAERQEWVQAAPEPIRHLVQRFHGPLIRWMLQQCDSPDHTLVDRLQQGFPIVGKLDSCGHETSGKPPRAPELSVDELIASRQRYNELVLRNIRDSDPPGVTYSETLLDFRHGSMTEPVPLTEEHIKHYHLSRRFVVSQWSSRKQSWKHRIVDHITESGINPATEPVDSNSTQSIDWQTWLILEFLRFALIPKQWKRDFSRAFKNCPIWFLQLAFMGSVFRDNGVTWFSGHVAHMFGAIAAGQAWHRIGSALTLCLMRMLRVPVGRFVDDCFGCNRSDVTCTGGFCLDVVASLWGLRVEPDKTENDMSSMLLLGSRITIDCERGAVSVDIDEEKAETWSESIRTALIEDRLESGDAAKMAGRMSFTVTITHDKVGRPFVRPLYRQQHAPTPGGVLTPWLRQSLVFWLAFLVLRPQRWFTPESAVARRHVLAWTDAAGDTRFIAAVILSGGAFQYSRYRVPDEMFETFIPRDDAYIGVLEMLAVWLLVQTFGHELAGAKLSLFVDNQGCLYSIIRASSRSPENNRMVAQLWLWLSRHHCDGRFFYVESKANIADGPTREYLELLQFFSAVECAPKLPAWALNMFVFSLADFASMLRSE